MTGAHRAAFSFRKPGAIRAKELSLGQHSMSRSTALAKTSAAADAAQGGVCGIPDTSTIVADDASSGPEA